MSELLNIQQAAARCGISDSSIRSALYRKSIPVAEYRLEYGLQRPYFTLASLRLWRGEVVDEPEAVARVMALEAQQGETSAWQHAKLAARAARRLASIERRNAKRRAVRAARKAGFVVPPPPDCERQALELEAARKRARERVAAIERARLLAPPSRCRVCGGSVVTCSEWDGSNVWRVRACLLCGEAA